LRAFQEEEGLELVRVQLTRKIWKGKGSRNGQRQVMLVTKIGVWK
jgi:hypothetical protein